MRWLDSSRGRHRRWLGLMSWLLWLVLSAWLGGVRAAWVEVGNTNTGPRTRLEAMHMHDTYVFTTHCHASQPPTCPHNPWRVLRCEGRCAQVAVVGVRV
jgi:hypothetical protein